MNLSQIRWRWRFAGPFLSIAQTFLEIARTISGASLIEIKAYDQDAHPELDTVPKVQMGDGTWKIFDELNSK